MLSIDFIKQVKIGLGQLIKMDEQKFIKERLVIYKRGFYLKNHLDANIMKKALLVFLARGPLLLFIYFYIVGERRN